MKYIKRVEENIELTYNWNNDLQNILTLSMHNNDNDCQKALSWIKSIEAYGTYENALKSEVIAELTKSDKNNSVKNEIDLDQIIRSIFGNPLK